MFIFNNTLLEIILRSAIVYVAVLAGLRLTGKREVGQMAPFELVLLILLANAVQNAMTGPDTSVSGGLVAAATLLVMNVIVTKLVFKSHGAKTLIEGDATVLIRNGKVLENNLKKEKLQSDDIQQALREHGVAKVDDVFLAMLEVDGTISVLKNDETPTVQKPHHHFRFIKK